ncbi:MAG: hypothetical protein M1825_001493 [Sarcosagium campestre]|nr:MAG: hypothetical protein M1825_001493 [Sarcosagium campestre]
MATLAEPAPTQSAADIASLLAEEEIPAKLRCAICNKLATNAFRLPCCDQSICERCQSSLPSACPVCEHSPLSANDCKPNKSLRTTIKVFLRTEAKKRETKQAKERVEAEALSRSVHVVSAPPTEHNQNGNLDLTVVTRETGTPDADSSADHGHAPDLVENVPDQSNKGIEESLQDKFDVEKNGPAEAVIAAREPIEISSVDGRHDIVDVGLMGPSTQANNANGASLVHPSQDMVREFEGIGQGMEGSRDGAPGMGWNGQNGFDAPMQNGMPIGGWGMFTNMTGMPGMNMDPMNMSQGMFGGYDGNGMGMNGMSGMSGLNMGMGMGYNVGQGGFGGWNGQAMWNGGQDKFNPNSHGGLANGMGDYGANAGFHPTAGGYNMQAHGPFNQMNGQQYQNNNYHENFHGQGYIQRGRGVGRGRGFGPNHNRFGFGPAARAVGPTASPHPAGLGYQPHQNRQPIRDTGYAPESEVKVLTHDKEEETKDAVPPAQMSEDIVTPDVAIADKDTQISHPSKSLQQTVPLQAPDDRRDAPSAQGKDDKMMVGTKDIMPPLGPAAMMQGEKAQDFAGRGSNIRGFGRGGPSFRGRGAGAWPNSNNGIPAPATASAGALPSNIPTAPKSFGVINAPKAPKALREGLPNTGASGRGFSILGRGGGLVGAALVPAAAAPITTPKRPSPEPSQARSRSRPRSASPERQTARQDVNSHRDRSRSPSVNNSDRSERRRDRRRRRDDQESNKNEGDDRRRQTKGKPSRDCSVDSGRSQSRSRSRSRTPSSSKRLSQRHERDPHRISRRQRRSHRDRSRDRRRRSKSRTPPPISERKQNHGSDRQRNNAEAEPDPGRHNAQRRGNRNDRNRERDRERNRNHKTGRPAPAVPTKPSSEADAHTREREARNRERLLKEQQRRDELDRDSSRKRERDVGPGGGGGGGGGDGLEDRSKRRKRGRGDRRVSYQYEDDGGAEARAVRIEKEREAARWG